MSGFKRVLAGLAFASALLVVPLSAPASAHHTTTAAPAGMPGCVLCWAPPA